MYIEKPNDLLRWRQITCLVVHCIRTDNDITQDDHKARAIAEFTTERLQSYYDTHSWVMRPAVESLQEGKRLQTNGHGGAAVVYFVTAIELLLKATLLKPVVHGLVHSEGLGEVIVQQAISQSGFDRYTKLLAKLFDELVRLDINAVTRVGVTEPLLAECTELQSLRNRIIHQGADASPDQAERARVVSVGVYDLIVLPMIARLGLKVVHRGEIKPA
jgi:hypothetical protein